MKKAYFVLFALATACSRAADPAPPKAPSHTVGWRVDGQDVTTSIYVTVSGQSGPLDVTGRDVAGGSEVSLEVPGVVGTYVLGTGAGVCATYTARGGSRYEAGAVPGANGPTGSGTVVLTSLGNGAAVGTFTFIGIDPVSKAVKTVTNGTFRMPF